MRNPFKRQQTPIPAEPPPVPTLPSLRPASAIQTDLAAAIAAREERERQAQAAKEQFDALVWTTMVPFAIEHGVKLGKFGTVLALYNIGCPASVIANLRELGYHVKHEAQIDGSGQPERLDIHWTPNSGRLGYDEVYCCSSLGEFELLTGQTFYMSSQESFVGPAKAKHA